MFIQALVSKSSVEAFDISILVWFAWIDLPQIHIALMRATSSARRCASPFVCIHRTKTRRSGAVTIFSKRLCNHFVLEHRLGK